MDTDAYEAGIVEAYEAELRKKDAEIKRLTEQAMKFRDMCLEKDKLITECADALDEQTDWQMRWMSKQREATK
jgi:hypothetical protein